jgi:hypothetical protein
MNKVVLPRTLRLLVALGLILLAVGTLLAFSVVQKSPDQKRQEACDRAEKEPDSSTSGISVDAAICIGQMAP